MFATLLGDNRYDDKVSSNSKEDYESGKEYDEYVLDTLNDIDINNLSADDQLNYRLMKLDYEVSLEEQRISNYYMSLNQEGGVQDYDLGNRPF